MFEKAHRPDGEVYTRLREDAPDWMRNAVHETHDDEAPNDWRYEMCAAIWDEITDDGDGGMEPWEYTSRLVDVYTGDLLNWLTPGRIHYVDQSLEEFPELSGGFAAHLANGQAYDIDRMAIILVDAYNDNYAEEAA